MTFGLAPADVRKDVKEIKESLKRAEQVMLAQQQSINDLHARIQLLEDKLEKISEWVNRKRWDE